MVIYIYTYYIIKNFGYHICYIYIYIYVRNQLGTCEPGANPSWLKLDATLWPPLLSPPEQWPSAAPTSWWWPWWPAPCTLGRRESEVVSLSYNPRQGCFSLVIEARAKKAKPQRKARVDPLLSQLTRFFEVCPPARGELRGPPAASERRPSGSRSLGPGTQLPGTGLFPWPETPSKKSLNPEP